MECSLKFIFWDENGEELARGEAQARLTEDSLVVMPKFGEALFFGLRDIDSIAKVEHSLELFFVSREKMELYHLGYRFADFLRVLYRLRSEMMLKDLLMQEPLRKSGLEARCIVFDENGFKAYEGKGEPRLYETALVLLIEDGEPSRVPYSFIENIEVKDYTLTLATQFGDKLVFSHMGREFDSFTETLSEIINELSIKVQSTLKEMLPQFGPSIIHKAARLMKEGKAARRDDLDTISPELWPELEKRLKLAGIKHEYDFLSSMAQTDKISIGLKRGLLGNLTDDYIWFLIPIYNLEQGRPGNAIAMEATSEGGRATYFFRIVSRRDYFSFSDLEDFHVITNDFITQVNRCMLSINFRREPIYLPEERLNEPRYHKYRIAIQNIPALQKLRHHFIGRVFHRSAEQWEQDVMNLLRFNVSAREDDLKWSKVDNS